MSTSKVTQHAALPCAGRGFLQSSGEAPSPTILAPAAGLTLPSLEGVQTVYRAGNGSDRYELVVAALLRAGAGRTPEFQKYMAKGFPDIGTLANTLLHSWLESLDPARCGVYLNLSFLITDYSQDQRMTAGDLSGQLLVLEAEANECSPLRLNDVLLFLEEEQTGLGAAFYRQLISAMNGMTGYYGESDAESFIDMLREGHEMDKDSDETIEQYLAARDIVLPDIATARPAWLPPSDSNTDVDERSDRKLLSSVKHPLLQQWCDAVLRLRTLSTRSGYRVRREATDSGLFEEFYDMWEDARPLPHWLVHFDDNDAITECFDDEQAHYLEVSHEPDFLALARYDRPAEIDRALQWYADYFCFQCALMELVRSIHAWQRR